MYKENLEVLRKNLNMNQVKGTMRHNINHNARLLPFQTREPERVKFARGFKGILGELSREICGVQLVEELESEEIITKIISAVEVNRDDEAYLRAIVREYLISEEKELNILHPYLFLYNHLTVGKQATGERVIATFIRDVLVDREEKLQKFFYKKETKHIILKLILNNLPKLEEHHHEAFYVAVLPKVKECFNQDIEFMLKHEEYFVKNIELIVAFYYFFYITQLTIKLAKKENADYAEIEKIFYLLDWETPSKNRNSVTSGYGYIKEMASELLLHINTLEHLNTIYNTQSLTLPEILKQHSSEPKEQQEEFLEALKSWINEYREFNHLPSIELESDFCKLEKDLEQSIIEKIEQGTKGSISRYSKNIEEIGKKYFLKTRGRYGYMLNMTQEMLLVLTAMCIKEEKITLTQLFIEYEKRGIFFDRYSKEEIVILFNKLNLIDKKSDSGDAQYVKSIL